MKALIMRFDAPLMSFGGVIVDQHGFIGRFPSTAMLTGLIANALGWLHKDAERLDALQSRLEYAARWDVLPQRLVDYHTVDMGQPKMKEEGWTTRGRTEHRAGGSAAKFGIHQRYRHYWMDGLMTVAVSLRSDGDPDVDAVASAMHRPSRPLFLGRKTCLPSRPLLDPDTPVAEGESLLQIFRGIPVWDRAGDAVAYALALEACWPALAGETLEGIRGEVRQVFDRRDWANQLPTGSTRRMEGLVTGGGRA